MIEGRSLQDTDRTQESCRIVHDLALSLNVLRHTTVHHALQKVAFHSVNDAGVSSTKDHAGILS